MLSFPEHGPSPVMRLNPLSVPLHPYRRVSRIPNKSTVHSPTTNPTKDRGPHLTPLLDVGHKFFPELPLPLPCVIRYQLITLVSTTYFWAQSVGGGPTTLKCHSQPPDRHTQRKRLFSPTPPSTDGQTLFSKENKGSKVTRNERGLGIDYPHSMIFFPRPQTLTQEKSK